MNAQRVKLNIVPGGVAPIVHVSQYDVGRVLEFALYDGVGIAEIESGTSIDIRGTKPDKTGFSYPCTFSGNVVSIATREQMTVFSGSFDCELHLVKDTQEIGTANFILEVEPAALSDDTVISDSEIPAIIEAARKNTLTDESVQTLVNSASAAASAATAAAESASSAAQSKTAAANSASEAAQSKTAAANSASAAAQSADTASAYNRYAYEYSTNAEHSAQSAAASARKALENATGTSVFSGSDPGLVPRSTKSNAFLRSDGKWDDTLATDEDLTALRTSLQTSFQNGVDTIYNAITAQGVTPSASTPSACATGISTVATNKYNAGKAEGKTEAEAVTWETAEMALFNGYVSLDSGASGQVSNHPVHVSASAIYDLTNVISFTITDIRGNAPCYYKIHYANGSASQNTKLSAGQTYTISSGKTIEFFNTGTTGVRSILVFGKFRYQAKILR